ncbi:MAG: T9SS type A sorting domain-containing protein [Bacteroidota bacterium]
MKLLRQFKFFILLFTIVQMANAQTINLPLTFQDSLITYTFTDFGGNSSVLGNDPTLSTNKVAIVTKSNTAELWAGTTMGGASGFASAIAFNSSRTIITMRVYSPDSGIAVRLKVEDPNDGSKSVETEARTTAANTWQTLSFNFVNQASGTAPINYTYTYKKASVFFNFGVTGAIAGTKVYYFDDVIFPAATGPVLSQIDLPIYFDSTNVNHTVTDFGGNVTTIIVDPTNSSNKVARSIKSNTAELWAGTTMSTSSGLASRLLFTSGNAFVRINVYSPDSGIAVRVKAEDPTDPTKSVETEARTTAANTWQTLTFNFANQAAGTAAINYGYNYKMLTVFFNFGITGAAAGTKTYLWDNVQFGDGSVVPVLNMPVTFESTTLNYGLTDFGGNTSSIVTDPIVSSNKACKVIKSNTAELWAGTTLGGTTGFGTAIPFTATAKTISMRVYSPTSGTPIRMKVEDANDPTRSVETEATTTVANEWQTLEFNFANQAAGTAALNLAYTYKKVSLFFNFGTTGSTAGEKTYYFDDVTFGSIVVVPQLNMPVTFESTTLNYGLTDFGGNTSSIVTDPMVSSNKACKVIKSNTAELWAGTTIGGTTGFGTAIPFTASAKTISMRVYSPTSGTPIRMKAEDANDPTRSVETEATTTVANGWETLSFNFANQANGTAALNLAFTYNKISVFCNFGTTGAAAGERTYYFDDIVFGGAVTPTKASVTFQVDMSKNKPAAGDTVTLNGTFNGWCGDCTKMTKKPGTDIWMTTILLDKDSSYDYKYVIGAWKSQEILKVGLPCTTTKSGFTNRLITVTKLIDTLPVVCWESCLSCSNTAPKAKVTFKVNMKNYVDDSLAIKGVTLNGSFNGWCGDCTKMTSIGNNVWSTTLTLDTGAYDFKFTIGNWLDQEQFNVTDPCTKTVGNFTNRFVDVKDTAAVIVGTYCWSTCNICNEIGVNEQTLNNIVVYPNPASESLFIDLGNVSEKDTKVFVYNMLGEIVLIKENNQNNGNGTINLDTRSLKPGIYLLKVQAGNAAKNIKFQKN